MTVIDKQMRSLRIFFLLLIHSEQGNTSKNIYNTFLNILLDPPSLLHVRSWAMTRRTTDKNLSIPALAALLGRGVVEVSEALEGLGTPIDRRTDSCPKAATWKALVEAAAISAHARAILRDEGKGPAWGDALDLRLLAEVQRLRPCLFPRTQSAAPTERRRVLVFDYLERLHTLGEGLEGGKTVEHHRLDFIRDLEAAGIRIKGRSGRNGALFFLATADGDAVQLLSYVVLKFNRYRRCAFVVNNLFRGGAPAWVAFICPPIQRTFLMRADEIRARHTSSDKEGKVSLTFRHDTPSERTLGHRLDELRADLGIVRGQEGMAQKDPRQHADTSAPWSLGMDDSGGDTPPTHGSAKQGRRRAPR